METNVYVLLAEGFEEIEAITPIDVLRRAECNVITVSITTNKVVNGAHNIQLTADELFENCNFSNADVIFLPGGMPGATNLNEHSGVKSVVLAQASKGKIVAAICAAPLVLGGLGLLEGKKATCYPSFENTLIGATHVEASCVVSENIITANGPGGAMPLALELVRQLKGIELATQLETGMMFSF